MESPSQRNPVSSGASSSDSNIPEHMKNLDAERGGGSLLFWPSLMRTEKHRVLVCVCVYERREREKGKERER